MPLVSFLLHNSELFCSVAAAMHRMAHVQMPENVSSLPRSRIIAHCMLNFVWSTPYNPCVPDAHTLPGHSIQQRGGGYPTRPADEGIERSNRQKHLGLPCPAIAPLQLSRGALLPRVSHPALQDLPVQRGCRRGVLPPVARHAGFRAHGATSQSQRLKVTAE